MCVVFVFDGGLSHLYDDFCVRIVGNNVTCRPQKCEKWKPTGLKEVALTGRKWQE